MIIRKNLIDDLLVCKEKLWYASANSSFGLWTASLIWPNAVAQIISSVHFVTSDTFINQQALQKLR